MLILMSMAYELYVIIYKPFNTIGLNMLEVFNELTVSACLYSYILLTDFVDSTEARASAGWGLTMTILTNIAVNLGISLS